MVTQSIMTTIIICVNFKKQIITLKLIAPIAKCNNDDDDSKESFFCQDTFLDEIDLTNIDLGNKEKKSLYLLFKDSLASAKYRVDSMEAQPSSSTDAQPSSMEVPSSSMEDQPSSSMDAHPSCMDPLLMPIDIKYKINRWIKNTNAQHCVVDMTEVTQYEFRQYRNFINDNFSLFPMLHS